MIPGLKFFPNSSISDLLLRIDGVVYMLASSQDKMSSKYYRRDIDGLRAIAILLVVIFHSGSLLFPSGFIGVDIFFVISGYLITNIITSQQHENTFKLSEFYRRRLWRIQPVLIFMWLVVCILISLTYLPIDYISYVHSQKYSSLLLANQYFGKSSAEYASPDTTVMPLLHTWSLAIEWQWYLILPLALLALKKVAPRLKPANAIYIFFAISLITSITVMSFKPFGGYYFLTTRIYEFLAGGCVIFLERRFEGKVNNKILNNILGLLAISIILYAALSQGVLRDYPNQYAILVTLSSGILIFIGAADKETILTKFFSSAPMTYLGKLSYSIYLWHWPIFSINNYIYGEMSAVRVFICMLITIILSFISYYFIETPLRKAKVSLLKTLLLLVLLPALLATVIYKVVDKNQGYSFRLGHNYDASFRLEKIYSQKALHRNDCLDGKQAPSECEFGDLKATRTALLIGDSNSNHFWGFWDVMGINAHVKFTALSTPSCLSLPGIYQFDWWIYKNQSYLKCYENTQHYYELIKNRHYDYVIIGEIWEQYAQGPWLINSENNPRSESLSQARMEEALRKALDIIIASGARPILMRTIAPMPKGYMACRAKEAILRHPYNKEACDSTPTGSSENEWTMGLFKKMTDSYPTLQLVDPKKVQCPQGECITQLNGIGIYRDVGHITDYASYSFGEHYLRWFGNPLK